jgi:hypothetical protein
MTFPGGKGGMFRQLINLIPPHRVYIETHLGGGAVLKNKLPATESIGIEIDERALSGWDSVSIPNLRLVHGDATSFLRSYAFEGDEFIYADPPYVKGTRRRDRIYAHELTDEQHLELLDVLDQVDAQVMVSGYPGELYERRLSHWHSRAFTVGAHGLRHQEMVWFNYAPPDVPFDVRFAGDTFRERQRIKRKQERLRSRIGGLTPVERDLLCRWLLDTYGEPQTTADVLPLDRARSITRHQELEKA